MSIKLPIYLDNHATTRVDPRVLGVMLPLFERDYGNAGSITHNLGLEAKQAVADARAALSRCINASAEELVFTSGATESTNLAIRGLAAKHPSDAHYISVTTEHRAVLDPLARLERGGAAVTLLEVEQGSTADAGRITAAQVERAIQPNTALVSVMLANNEIGVLQPIDEIAAVCRAHGVPLHCDASQALGKIPVDVATLGIDLLSASAHKLYGPKGVGLLYVSSRRPRIRLEPQLDGGGQEHGLRSGTLNVPGIVGFARAAEIAVDEMKEEAARIRELRDRLYVQLSAGLDGVTLNGPKLDRPDQRLPGNLNVSIGFVEGQALLLELPALCVSSGSACTAAHPEPSHVLRALGLDADMARSSLRFGIGRFNTAEEIDAAAAMVIAATRRLRGLSSMA